MHREALLAKCHSKRTPSLSEDGSSSILSVLSNSRYEALVPGPTEGERERQLLRGTCLSATSRSLVTLQIYYLHGFGSLVSLGTEVGGCLAALREEAGEDGLDERAEDDLGTTVTRGLVLRLRDLGRCRECLPSLGESHPQNQAELEGVIERWF